MPYIEELVKEVACTLIEDCSRFLNTATAPARIAYSEIASFFLHYDTASRIRLENNRSRAEISNRFFALKSHFKSAPDRDGKYVYYFLCNIESLPYPQNEELMFMATAMIDAEPEQARIRIGQTMHLRLNNGNLRLSPSKTLALDA